MQRYVLAFNRLQGGTILGTNLSPPGSLRFRRDHTLTQILPDGVAFTVAAGWMVGHSYGGKFVRVRFLRVAHRPLRASLKAPGKTPGAHSA